MKTTNYSLFGPEDMLNVYYTKQHLELQMHQTEICMLRNTQITIERRPKKKPTKI